MPLLGSIDDGVNDGLFRPGDPVHVLHARLLHLVAYGGMVAAVHVTTEGYQFGGRVARFKGEFHLPQHESLVVQMVRESGERENGDGAQGRGAALDQPCLPAVLLARVLGATGLAPAAMKPMAILVG